jgi:Zn-dependent M16 (insulinase) family peptidase
VKSLTKPQFLKKMAQSYFEQQCNFKVDYAPAVVKKWRSTRTGLQVTLVDQASPIVNGYFAVATEILNDSGCPHTLEHLIFMGSKKYPYKGLLDILGNLAFSSTNAWTATDQTVYTLTTAGWEGFKMLLPVYLDHLFNPTITDAACYTEVYHVGGDGKEKGVVYSEMQGIENQSWFIQNLESQRTLYKKSGYKSETGGLTKNLRTLDADTIRKYHADNYRPDNLCVIVTGSIEEDELLKIMVEFDSELQSLPETASKRPFVDTPRDLPLTETVTKNVTFPDKDESSGNILISWIGPDSTDSVLDQAIDILGKYMTSSSVSLFSQNFIEVEDPWATDSSFYTESYVLTGMVIGFDNVPTSRLQILPAKVLELMKNHCNENDLDIVRLRDLVEQTMWKYVHKAEKSPANLGYVSIFEFEYGKESGKDLEKYCKTLDEFTTLLKWDISQWVDVFRKYYVDNHSAIVTATPSKELYKQNKIENERILKERKEKLGPEGLKNLEDALEKAQEQNNKKIPDEILAAFGKPDPSTIKFINTESIAVGLNKEIENAPSKAVEKIVADTPTDFPLYAHFENYESNFTSIQLLFSSFELDKKHLPLLKVFEGLTTLPIVTDDGELIPYEDVVKQLKRDTIQYHFGNSFNGMFDEFMALGMTVKNENYDKAIEWFNKLMFKTKFTKERVTVTLKKLIKSLPELKRSGNYMLRYLYNKHFYTDRSLLNSGDVIENEEYLKKVLEEIEDGNFEVYEKQLNEIREELFKSSNIRLVIFGDVNKIQKPISSWSDFAGIVNAPKKLSELPYQVKTLSTLGKEKTKKCFVINTPGSDSSFMNLVTNSPLDEYTSDDTFKIILGAEYLQSVEGPFWRGIRGAGLAYGANCFNKTPVGELCYSVYRGADVEKCFSVAKEIVRGFADGEVPIDDSLRQGAVSSIVNRLAESQSNYSQAATSQFHDNVLVKRGPEYNSKLMKALSSITNEELVDIFKRYFVNLFNPEKSLCFVSCNPSKSDDIQSFFKDLKYEVEVEEVSVSDKDGEVDDEDDQDADSATDSDEGCDGDSDEDSNEDSDEEQ